MDNIIAALEYNDRIYQVKLYNFPSSLMEKMLAAMQKPFPALTSLWLGFLIHSWADPPTDLVEICLWRIPHSAYISPEEIATCLSALTRLEEFRLRFK
jgi:hypothetical protein